MKRVDDGESRPHPVDLTDVAHENAHHIACYDGSSEKREDCVDRVGCGPVEVAVGLVPGDIVSRVEKMQGDRLWCGLQRMWKIWCDLCKQRDRMLGECRGHGRCRDTELNRFLEAYNIL